MITVPYLNVSILKPVLIVLIFSITTLSCKDSSPNKTLSSTQTHRNQVFVSNAVKLSESAYVFAFPMVEHFKRVREYLGTDSEIGANTFVHLSGLATPEDRDIIGPNNDTLNSSIMLDLRAEPVVVSIPDIFGRYFSMQLLNIVTDNLPIIASEQEGSVANDIIIAGPDWDSSSFNNEQQLPIIYSDSSVLFALLRVGVENEADLAIAQTYQHQVSVLTLSNFFGDVPPAAIEPINWPAEFNVKANDSAVFFSYMNFMMQFHTFNETENELLATFSPLGIGVDEIFELASFDTETQTNIANGISAARSAIRFPEGVGEKINGWAVPNPLVGDYGDDYNFRAVIAWYGTYALPISEAAYARATVDSSGDSLSGTNAYKLHFSAENIPEADYFWSLTMYDAEQFLVSNNIERYSLGDRSDLLSLNDDGSLTIYLQKESPGVDFESNWLPAPDDDFSINMRMYGPREDVISGNYVLPVIELIQ